MRRLALRRWTKRVGSRRATRKNRQESRLLLCVNAGGVFFLSRLSKTVCAFFTILTMFGVATCGSSSTAASDPWPDLPPSVGDTLAEWTVYQNDEYRFRIKYPTTFEEAEVPSSLVTNGAVVSFVPGYDPSVNEAGERTNLISFSVTIGVSNSEDVFEQKTQTGALDDLQSRVWTSYPHFVRSCLFEGAVGNRYKSEVFATTFAGKRYEIALFVHSANPGCYPAGVVTIFDSAEIAWLFETMVSSFSPRVAGARRWVE